MWSWRLLAAGGTEWTLWCWVRAEGHKRVSSVSCGIWGVGSLTRQRQRRAIGCSRERTKHIPGSTVTGETLNMSPGYRASRSPDPGSKRTSQNHILTALPAAKSKYMVPQVVSEGSRHWQLLLALGHPKPLMMSHCLSILSFSHEDRTHSHQTRPGLIC